MLKAVELLESVKGSIQTVSPFTLPDSYSRRDRTSSSRIEYRGVCSERAVSMKRHSSSGVMLAELMFGSEGPGGSLGNGPLAGRTNDSSRSPLDVPGGLAACEVGFWYWLGNPNGPVGAGWKGLSMVDLREADGESSLWSAVGAGCRAKLGDEGDDVKGEPLGMPDWASRSGKRCSKSKRDGLSAKGESSPSVVGEVTSALLLV